MTKIVDQLISPTEFEQDDFQNDPLPKRVNRVLYDASEMPIRRAFTNFIMAKRGSVAQTTTKYYEQQLNYFLVWCDNNQIKKMGDIDIYALRAYQVEMRSKKNHTARSVGGLHAAFRPIKVFLNWYEGETDRRYISQFSKLELKHPKMQYKKGVSLEDFRALWDETRSLRDQCILLVLFDTGVRSGSLLRLNWKDIHLHDHKMEIHHAKGDKEGIVIFSTKTAKKLASFRESLVRESIKRIEEEERRHSYDRSYRIDRSLEFSEDDPVFTSHGKQRLTYWGLNSMIRRLCRAAGTREYGLHDFRRGFATEYLRNLPGDLIGLQHKMLHEDIKTTSGYVNMDEDQLRQLHIVGSPLSNLKLPD